jgi:hypothetical protein
MGKYTFNPLSGKFDYYEPSGSGGGQVDSVVGGTGVDVNSTDPVNPEVNLDTATQTSLGKADTAIQAGDLATVATTGDYDDLTDKPTLLELGETSSTAYRGDRGKIAYDHSQLTSGNPHNVTKSDVGLGSVDNTSDATLTSAILNTIYPIGILVELTVSTNPGTLFGIGTWTAHGTGRVTVSKAASGTFGTAGATGGTETHTLTTAEIPAHTHANLVSGSLGVRATNAGFQNEVSGLATGSFFRTNWSSQHNRHWQYGVWRCPQ